MWANVIRDGELFWEERPDPTPGDTEVLVAVAAAGVNAADLLQRKGFYPAPPGSPSDIPGLELAGTVAACGPRVTAFQGGERVMALVGGGAQATMALVEESHLLSVPEGIAWDAAGGFPEAFTTAHDALFPQAECALGDSVLVSGAAGGVGTAGVQLAALAGAHVTASVRNPSLRDAVAALGAAAVIDPVDVPAHGPYDVVLELIGAASLETALPTLAIGGRVVVIGVGGGGTLELSLLNLMARRARIMGSTLRARDRGEKALVAKGLAASVVPHLAAGRLEVPVAATFPLDAAGEAYARFAEGGKLGKVVLVAP